MNRKDDLWVSFFLRIMFCPLVFVCILSVNAQRTISPANSQNFRQDRIYVVNDAAETPVYELDMSNGLTNYNASTHEKLLFNFSSGTSRSTVAIGPYYKESQKHGVGPYNLVGYFWYWGSIRNLHRVTTLYPDSAIVEEVTTSLDPPGGDGLQIWSGGEVNQLTGEIYLSSAYNAYIQTSFRLGVYNPYTNNMKISGRLRPKTPQDSISGIPGSDMAIDSDGNAYLMMQGSNTLIYVEIGENGENWRYSKAVTFNSNAPTPIYGMAFYNGKLYVLSTGDDFYELNPLEKTISPKKDLGGSIALLSLRDIAAAQTAMIIRGTVYNDLNGDGTISDNEKNITGSGTPSLEGDTIEIYDSNKTYKGFTTTNASGQYFLVLDQVDTDYYIRLKHPRVNGIKAVQTWASAGTHSNQFLSDYTVTAYSHNPATGDRIELSVDSACNGAHSGGDPNTHVLDDAMIYSKIHVGVNITGIVDFGITAMSDLGDAPYQSKFTGETTGAAAPAHLTHNKLLYLGNDVTTDNSTGTTVPEADTDIDDGVWVVLNGKNIALPDTVLEAGISYTIKVKTSGPLRTSGYLNVFSSCNATGTISTSSFTTRLGTADLQSSLTNDTITFTYTVPAGIPQGMNTSYMRFRFSNVPGLNATGNPDPAASANYWALYGEVEDYKVYLRRQIELPPALTITWPTATQLTYGESLGQAGRTGGSVTGGTTAQRNGNFMFKNKDIYPTVANSNNTSYTYLFVPADQNTYRPIEKPGGMTVTVKPKSISVDIATVSNKFFDNNTPAYVRNVTFTGLVFNDKLVKGTDYTATGAFSSPAIETGKSVNVTVQLQTTPLAANYTLTSNSTTATASILNAPAGNGVVIGIDDDSHLSYTILYLASKTKGLRLPRLTSNARNALNLNVSEAATAASAKGLLIFNTDSKKLQYWNGEQWNEIDGSIITWTAGTALPKTPAEVVIGSTADNTDWFALLKIESTGRGIRLPRVKSDVANALATDSSREGLLIFNSDNNQIQYWNGDNWIALAGSQVSASSTGSRPNVKGLTIGDINDPPFHSELAFVESTVEKAIQLPCLTVAARNNLLTGAGTSELAAAAGLIIFNCDTKKLELFDGTNWITI
ncbi:MAG: YDG domain-containing protein [Prevotellaceae bacterium]|jgi:hypothetical protein|nr:YDG domain-containing protein [Prevotellaceae bacterium]